MGVKKLTVKGDTVDFAIRNGLNQLGLPQDRTLIKILQRESQSLFGYKPAVVSIIFDETEAERAKAEKQRREFVSKFQFRYDAGVALVKVPACFYDEQFAIPKEKREQFIIDFLEEHDIPDPEDDRVKHIVEDFQCQYDFVPVKKLDVHRLNMDGGSIHLRKSPDLMTAKAIIFHGSDSVTEEQVYRALKENQIVKGIRKANIQRVLENRYTGFFEVAKGVPAVDDRFGNMEKFFQEDEHKEFTRVMEQLTIDTRSVKDINIADRNQLLLRVDDVIPGSPGYRIDGVPVSKKDITDASQGLKIGANVYFSDDAKEVYAKQSGHIVWKPEEHYIDVEPIYIVEGDVDFSEGNIIGFVGKVLIKGDVKSKFSVIAEGDIEIHGSVEDAVVKSTNSSVFIGGGVIHRAEGMVQAKETVQCNIATNAHIRAKKICVEKEVMNSRLEAEDEIQVMGNPGVIVGGEVSANQMIRANTIGSERWVRTKVAVGDVTEVKKRQRSLQQKGSQLNSQLREAQQIHDILTNKAKNTELTVSQKTQLERVKQEIPEIQEKLQDMAEEEERNKKLIEARRKAKLEVIKNLHPQVEVNIFDATFTPRSAEKYSGFKARAGEIQRYSL